MTARSSKPSTPGELQRFVLSLRPAISDLLAGYDVSGEEATTLLREAVELLALRCGSLDQPRHFFLQTLEDRCAAYAEAEAAKESQDDGTPEA